MQKQSVQIRCQRATNHRVVNYIIYVEYAYLVSLEAIETSFTKVEDEDTRNDKEAI